jgi:hypothetical protein
MIKENCNKKRSPHNYNLIIGIIVIILFLSIFIIPKYFAGNVIATEEISKEIEKIEVIHFHGTNQCSSCVSVGNFAEETINNYFQNELNSGKITFQHINAELSENYLISKKYQVKSSSLWIGIYYKDGTFSKEENVNVWYKIDDEQNYMNYLKSVIESKLFEN